jgi:PhnB protein
MSKQFIQPYLFFSGRCEEALEFYKKAIGAEVIFLMRHKDSPQPPPPGMVPPNFGEKIMHVSFRVGETEVMASDGCESSTPKFEGFALSLSTHTAEEANRAFAALSEGGTVKMPLSKTFWAPLFGMVDDKFGVSWMVNVCDPNQPKP